MYAPVALNIVCFGLRECRDGALNKAIVLDLYDRGTAAPSTTKIDGWTVIRAAIVNHRTTKGDIDRLFVALQGAALRVLRMWPAVVEVTETGAAHDDSRLSWSRW